MFTGLVQALGTITAASTTHDARGGLAAVRLTIDPHGWLHASRDGDSISVSGCCLTLLPPDDSGRLAFNVIAQTLALTKPDWWAPGSRVNLERAVRADSLMGGHIVQGHVDGIGRVTRVQTGDDYRITIAPPPHLCEYLTPKGSICVDGVSLTLAEVDPTTPNTRGTFTVALIPTTLQLTTLASLREGDAVNLEMDVLAKTIVHWMKNYAQRSNQ